VFNTGADTMLKCLAPYAKSSSPSVSFDAMVVLLFIGSFLKKSDLKHLLLSPDQMDQIMFSLKSALRDGTTLHLYDATCSIKEVMVWLEKAALLEENINLMVDHGMLDLFPALMSTQDSSLVSKVVKLMWTLASVDKVKETLCQCSDVTTLLDASHLEIMKYVKQCLRFSSAGKFHAICV
jgi:hypothetical protein